MSQTLSHPWWIRHLPIFDEKLIISTTTGGRYKWSDENREKWFDGGSRFTGFYADIRAAADYLMSKYADKYSGVSYNVWCLAAADWMGVIQDIEYVGPDY